MTHKTAKELQPGETFTLTTRKNAHQFTVANQSDAIEKIGGPGYINPPADQIGKYLIIVGNCRQIVLPPDADVYVL